MKHLKNVLAMLLVLTVCTGCGSGTDAGQARTQPDYTVVSEDAVPEELAAQIDTGSDEELRLVYADGGALYLVRSYGRQPAGSSIQVVDLYGDADGLHLDTQLVGGGQAASQTTSAHPYIVVKLLADEQNVVFE